MAQSNTSRILLLSTDDERRDLYSLENVREGIFFNCLYFGHVLIPINFLLDNPIFDSLFRYKGKISEKSEISRLIISKHVTPVAYGDVLNIKDLANLMIRKQSIIHCTEKELKDRAELLNTLNFEIHNKKMENYNSILQEYLFKRGKEYKKSNEYFSELYFRVKNQDILTRSDAYRYIESDKNSKRKNLVRRIIDASYFDFLAQTYDGYPCVPSSIGEEIFSYNTGLAGKASFLPKEDREIGNVQDLKFFNICQILDELKDDIKRKEWLSIARKNVIIGSKSMNENYVFESICSFSNYVKEYLRLDGRSRKLMRVQTRAKYRMGEIIGWWSSANTAVAMYSILFGQTEIQLLSSISTIIGEIASGLLGDIRENTRISDKAVIPFRKMFTPEPRKL